MKKKTTKKKTGSKVTAKKVVSKSKKSTKVKGEVILDIPPLHEDARNAPTKDRSQTRFEAGFVYTTSMTNISVSSLTKDPRFKEIPRDTLLRWAKEDKWAEKRKAMFASIKDGLEERLKSKLTEAAFQRVQNLLNMRNFAFEQIMKVHPTTGLPLLPPKSWEGMAKIVMDADKNLDEIRRLIAGDVANLQPGQQAIPAPEGAADGRSGTPAAIPAQLEYDEEELREAAKVITKMRRDDLRKREAERIAAEAAAKEKKQKIKIVNIKGSTDGVG